MTAILGSVLFVVFVWWFSTGAVVWLARLDQSTFPLIFALATLVMIACVAGLAISSSDISTRTVVVAFCCVIGIWAWHEMAFLFGYITGPNKAPCPTGCVGWARFGLAFNALKHHELALLATLVVVAIVTWNGANAYGLAAFIILWLMRISAKLNIFVGVPHFSDELLPARLRHLATYFKVAPVGWFFIATMLISSVVAGGMIGFMVIGPEVGDAHATGMAVLLSVLLLAMLEHGFMALPVRDAELWRWAMTNGGPQPARRADATVGVAQTRGRIQHATKRAAETPLMRAAHECGSVGGSKNGL